MESEWAALERHAAPTTFALADLLLPAGDDLARKEMDEAELHGAETDARRIHALRMDEIALERTIQEEEIARLHARLSKINQDAALDTRSLASTVYLLPHLSSESGASSAWQQQLEDHIAAQRAVVSQATQLAEEREVLAEAARMRAATALRTAISTASRREALMKGLALHRWDDKSRTLRPCEVAVVAEGRCFQVESERTRSSSSPTLILSSPHRTPELSTRPLIPTLASHTN